MADRKISLDKKADSNVQIKEVSQKLDFLISEIQTLRHEVDSLKSNMSDLQEKNREQLYRLDSQFYKLCSDLQNQIYKFQSAFYEGSRDVKDELKELQDKTRYSRFVEKILPWTPAILIGGAAWMLILRLIFE
ncbi:MAG: hypothetical protein J5809_07180 [Selenomonadaceae bacterium]|nr:hypothetical protein [Selenomonadaceae bacterium]